MKETEDIRPFSIPLTAASLTLRSACLIVSFAASTADLLTMGEVAKQRAVMEVVEVRTVRSTFCRRRARVYILWFVVGFDGGLEMG